MDDCSISYDRISFTDYSYPSCADPSVVASLQVANLNPKVDLVSTRACLPRPIAGLPLISDGSSFGMFDDSHVPQIHCSTFTGKPFLSLPIVDSYQHWDVECLLPPKQNSPVLLSGECTQIHSNASKYSNGRIRVAPDSSMSPNTCR